MKKILILLILFLSVFINGYGQFSGSSEYGYLQPYNSFNNIPINFSTGSPNLSIPIWTVSDNSISFPISVSYSANGVRLEEIPSCVGISWQLNAFGTISRIVRDEDDLDSHGFKTTGYKVIDPNMQNTTYYNEIEHHPHIDSEADLFRINLAGLSYSFMYDNTGTLDNDGAFFTLTESKIIIEYFDTYNDNGIDKYRVFIITDASGIKYMFENLKKNWNCYNPDCDDNYTVIDAKDEWHVTKITNPNTNDIITFEYEETDSKYYPTGKHFLYNYIVQFWGGDFAGNTGDKNFGSTILEQVNNGFVIKSIETGTEKIEFIIKDFEGFEGTMGYNTCFTSENLHNPDPILDSIKVINKLNNDIIYTYSFLYNVINNRIFLDQIQQKGSEGTKLNPYHFTYYKPYDLPYLKNDWYEQRQKKRTDFWRFINDNVTYGHDNTRPCEYEYRFPNEDYTGLGMLNEVFYPNGSFTEYEYEANTYSFSNSPDNDRYDEKWSEILTANDYTSFDNLIGPGCRIKKIFSSDGSQCFIKEFSYETNGISNGRLTNYPLLQYSFNYNVDDPDGSLCDSAIIKSSNDINVDMGYIMYDKITVFDGGSVIDSVTSDIKGINGKTEYYFDTYQAEETDVNADFPYPLKLIPYNKNGLLLQKKVYDNNNNLKSIDETNYYIEETEKKSVSLKLVNNKAIEDLNYLEPPYIIPRELSFLPGNYTYNQRKINVNYNTSTVYSSDNSGASNTNTVTYEYDRNGNDCLYTTRIIKALSNGDIVRTELYYPEDDEYDGVQVYEEMRDRNILSPTVKKEVFKNDVRISGENTLYRTETFGDLSLIVPDQSQILEDGTYKTITWFDKYDNKGHILESHGISQKHNAVIYGYNNSIPVASVTNARYQDIFYTSFEEDTGGNIITGDAKTGEKYYSGNFHFDFPEYFGIYIVSYWKKNAEAWNYFEEEVSYSTGGYNINGEIDEVRAYPKNAFMSTLTYKPLTGKTSETDANSNSVYYEYNEFGQLIKVYDQDKKLIKENEYNQTETYFYINGRHSVAENCTTALVIETGETSATKNITYEWFDDNCGGNLISTDASLYVVNPELSYPGEATFYARIAINGVYSPCKEHKISLYEPYFENVGEFDEEIQFYLYTVDASSCFYIFSHLYHGCNNWSFTVQDDGSGGTDWLTVTKNSDGLLIETTENTNDSNPVYENEYRQVLIQMTDDDGTVNQFVFRQLEADN